MLFNANNKSKKLSVEISAKKQCVLCPLRKEKGCDSSYSPETEVLFLTDKMEYTPISSVFEYKTAHAFMVECGVIGAEPPQQAVACCTGRKIDLIDRLRPKMVICAGYPAFKTVEEACGNNPEGYTDLFFYPTRLKRAEGDHEFWLLQIPPWDISANVNNLEEAIHFYMANPPVTLEANYDGVHLITRNEDIDEAFDWLEKQEYLAYDIETHQFRPYAEENVILTISFGTNERTYVFPLLHPQTPSSFDVGKVIQRWRKLTKPKLIAHNAPFEMERTAHLFNALDLDGYSWIYEVHWEDTQAQAYVTNMPGKRSKSLNSCVRRAFGFDLKSKSNIAVDKLREMPLEQVLLYNALDVKYTYMVYFEQRETVEELDLMQTYLRNIKEAMAAVAMQLVGLPTNQKFVQDELAVWEPRREEALARWHEFAQVKNIIAKYGKCEPGSDDDVRRLFVEQLGAPPETEKFNGRFLRKFSHPLSKVLLDFRAADKMLSTYLVPYAKHLAAGGYYIWEDGLVHVQFNTMLTNTGRWSSSEPNGQNYPSRGGKKYLRNVIISPDGDLMVAIDMAQIEYRVAASLTNDPIMIDGLFNDFDVHMFWALETLKYFPFLLDDHTDKKKLKEFRSSMKSAVVFALIYGAGAKRIADSLDLEPKYLNKVYALIEQFWGKHGAIKEWQNTQKYLHNTEGVIMNALGRKYYAPLTHNQICNFPIQGTASDMLIEALTKLMHMQIVEGAPWRIVLNIHDDITFFIPKNKLDDALEVIVPTMLHTETYKDWLKVPLGVEVSVGTEWGSLKEYGNFFSHQLVA